MIEGEALGVHVFVVTGGEHRAAALAFVRALWVECGARLGMTEPVPGVGVGMEPRGGWTAHTRGLLAVRGDSGPGVRQAVLRRDHDVLCLSVMLAPDAAENLGWAELDAHWSDVVRAAGPGAAASNSGTLGETRLYLARLVDPCAQPAAESTGALAATLRSRAPGPPDRVPEGVVTPQGFAVWELLPTADTRIERRLVAVAGHERDPELTAWAWTDRNLNLPPLAKYLLHAAKLRYELRVWRGAEDIATLRAATDATIKALLERTAVPAGPRRQSEILRASHALVALQARERGLVDRSTLSREMARTVEIAAANLALFAGDESLGGPFADDRALADWLVQRLDDEATYLEAAVRRCEQVGSLADQLVQRSQQRRQETVNLGLTGAIGAIVMSLGAVQALQYTVPLPGPVKPAVVTALGALALLASLVVLRVVAPERSWSLVLVRLGAGAVGAALAWIGVAAFGDWGAAAGATWAGAVVGAVLGVLVSFGFCGRDRGH
ncbi:CATRA conflict system CASPASE/TPR repeat-associated protein [Streptomyces justiciae]|uniref:BN6_48550 family protein n=1 Tax=Streptomyces justiciae TaxID=2780140 RepID=A0ABU3M7V1_9ACTN|nr:CATRA conflict system CASPASE/TPR repeat-associated protein [Streptomyces justiciae]MDT7847569.1 BN6_48550 family protein [Streptomyces justiciae]